MINIDNILNDIFTIFEKWKKLGVLIKINIGLLFGTFRDILAIDDFFLHRATSEFFNLVQMKNNDPKLCKSGESVFANAKRSKYAVLHFRNRLDKVMIIFIRVY